MIMEGLPPKSKLGWLAPYNPPSISPAPHNRRRPLHKFLIGCMLALFLIDFLSFHTYSLDLRDRTLSHKQGNMT